MKIAAYAASSIISRWRGVEFINAFSIQLANNTIFTRKNSILSQNNFTAFKALARHISLVENQVPEAAALMEQLRPLPIPVVGFTGPPGAGKSTLLNALLGFLLEQNKRVALLLVDPSSPFNFGALLGDRLRMSHYFTHPNVFIRSVATRGSLGGLSDTILEVTEVLRTFPFDVVFVETVGVGQSEVEIAGLADVTVVTLVPEAGDAVQAMKAGLMEIADIFVINKADRPGAEAMAHALELQLHLNNRNVPVLRTTAVESVGIPALWAAIMNRFQAPRSERQLHLLTEKCLRLIQKKRMQDIDIRQLRQQLATATAQTDFSIFRFIKQLV